MNQADAVNIAHHALIDVNKIYSDSLVAGYLFGSYARGDFDDESDVNILFVIDCDDNMIHNQDNQLARLANQLSLFYDITVSIKTTSLHLFNSFIFDDIRTEGIQLPFQLK